MTKKAPVSAVRKIAAVAAVAATFAAPLLSAQALASPSTTPVVPTVPQHAQVEVPLPVNTPTTEAPAPPNATTHAPTIQAPTTKVPVTTVPATTQPAPTSHAPVTTSPVRPTTSAPVVTGSPTPSHPVVVTTTGSSPAVTSSMPGVTTTGPSGRSGVTGTSTLRTTGSGGQSAVITKGSTTATVPVATIPRGVPASRESVQAAKVAPAAEFNAAQPSPARGNFNDQVQAAVRVNVDHDVDVYRPRHWEYVDYDEYHRPSFYNPLATDMSFRYFYNGEYRTAFVPAGGRVLLDAVAAGVFAFTAVAGDFVSVGSFYGGCWMPPVGWVGPPPADWRPWEPVSYTGVPVDFANIGQTVLVDQVTMVGHDDNLPVGQRDVVMLNDSTLARGEIQPSLDGGPPQVTLQQTQSLPGVGQWDDGHQYINAAIQKPAAPPDNHLPWIIGGLVAVLALLGGVAARVWKHRYGDHERADAPTDTLDPYSPTGWLSCAGAHPDTEPVSPGVESTQWPEAPPRVQAVPRPDGSPVVTLRETPERGEATHALRLEAHSGLSTLTVREVDR